MKLFGLNISFLKSVVPGNEKRSIENPNTPLNDYISPTGGAGISPSRGNARSISIIYAATRIIAEDFASMPLSIVRQSGGHYETVDHDLNYLMGVSPNAAQNAFSYKETSTANIYSDGNAYTYLRGTNSIESLDYLEPDEIMPFFVKETGRIAYKNIITGEVWDSEDIVHVPFLNFTQKHPRSLSPLDILRESIRVHLNNREYSNSVYKNGAFPSIVLEHPAELSDAAMKRLQNSIHDQHSGPTKAGKVLIAEEGMKANQLKMTPADVEMIASQRWTTEELLRPYRVPAHMANSLERSTNNNIEQQSLEYVMFCQRPLAKRWEAELDKKTITRRDYDKGYRWKVNLRSLLRGDVKTQTEHIQRMVTSGVMSRNEARDFLGLPYIDGLDEMLVPVNLFEPSAQSTKSEFSQS